MSTTLDFMATAFTSLRKSINFFTTTYGYLGRSRLQGADLETLKSGWAQDALNTMDIAVQVSGDVCQSGPLILVGNHISYLDIPLLMSVAPKVSFVAKSEINRWPIIGEGARAMGTVFVRREDDARRATAKAAIIAEIERGGRIGLFPAGTTCMYESKPWRHGAFEIAKRCQIPIQPFRIRYSPLRPAAFIGQDFFVSHLFQLAQAGGVSASIEFHEPVFVKDVAASCEQWREWAREGLSAET